MKMKIKLTLALIMAVTFTGCNNVKSETTDISTVETSTTGAFSATEAITETTKTEDAVIESVNESVPVDEALNEAEVGVTTIETTTATTTVAKNEPAICGSYRSAIPAYPMEDAELAELEAAGEYFEIYDYINIEQHKDGSFQVEFRFQIGSSGNDFASFDTEALGTANWYSFYFDGDMGVPQNNGPVTITSDGTTAWVTFDGGEPQEFIKTE
jgi:hypothetical protein